MKSQALNYMTKSEYRKEVRQRIGALSAEERQRRGRAVFSKIEGMTDIQQAKTIALYASLDDEVPTADMIARLAERCRVVLPRVEGETMEFYEYLDGALRSGAFGIDEPIGEKAVSPEEIDVMIVPARAFTLDGKRLGRGKGFYDRYISRPSFRATTIGVCFAEQVFDDLPTEEHDHKIDSVVFA